VTETPGRRKEGVRAIAALLACLVLLICSVLVACGSGDEDDDGRAAAPGPQGASVTVSFQPKGPDGPSKRTRIECERLGEGSERCRNLARLTAEQLAPVPPDVACAERYGGPAQARVTGVVRGERVDARFNRTDACETRRWNDNAALLEP
jgi:hypothetical protein